jgi:hypothetical protein
MSIATANCATANMMITGPNRMLNGIPMSSNMIAAIVIAIHDRRHVAHAVNHVHPSMMLTSMRAGMMSSNL